MLRVLSTAVVIYTLATALAASQGAPRQPDTRPTEPRPRTLTLTGCVERGATPTQYVIQDEDHGRFEVNGSDIKKYLGQRVQVAGQPGSTRFRVRGGLWPSPNAAARGGDLDPSRAAVEAMPGGPNAATGEINLPTFKVKSVRTLGGGCE